MGAVEDGVGGPRGVLDDEVLEFGHADGEPGGYFHLPLVVGEGTLGVVVDGVGGFEGGAAAAFDGAVCVYEEHDLGEPGGCGELDGCQADLGDSGSGKGGRG